MVIELDGMMKVFSYLIHRIELHAVPAVDVCCRQFSCVVVILDYVDSWVVHKSTCCCVAVSIVAVSAFVESSKWCNLKEIAVTKSAKRIGRPATHSCTSGVSSTATRARTHRIISRSRRHLRVVAASLPLPSEHRVVKCRMHAPTAHASKARSGTTAERIVWS
jgi:hypothetical protein